MINRRDFILNTGLITAGALLLPELLKAEKIKSLGIQLWTVKDAMEKDPKGTIEKLAKFGYNEVESFGMDYFKFGPKEFRKIVEANGMKIRSSHSAHLKNNASDPNPDGIQKTVDDAAEAGQKYLVAPWLQEGCRDSEDSLKKTAEYFNQYGELCKKAGLKFGYHNHDFEFQKVGDKMILDHLLDNTDPSLVCFELDLYWVVSGNQDPIAYFKKYPGRFPLWHVKDMDKQEKKSTIVGTGRIDFVSIFKNAKLAGLDLPIVEQEEFKLSSMESAKACIANLRKLNY